MPILDRTSLNASDKADFLLNAVSCQAFGDISRVANQFGISRKTTYRAKEIGLSALGELLEQPERSLQVKVDEAQIKRTIIALTITAPNSIRAI